MAVKRRIKQAIKRPIKAAVYPLYARRLLRNLDRSQTPHHVGVILDGNRRWAKVNFGAKAAHGHKKGAAKIIDLLDWCEESEVSIITLWLLSTDNLKRDPEELETLLQIIAETVETLASTGRWEVNCLGALDLLPEWMQLRLKSAQEKSHGISPIVVKVAIGYGGRREIIDAVRRHIDSGIEAGKSASEISESVSIEAIGAHLYTRGLPDPELVIRTSGEQRLGGFLLWQSANSEFYFCEAYWPDFRKVDFLRALRAYSVRHRRHGL